MRKLSPRASADLLIAALAALLLLANHLINSATRQSSTKTGYTELTFTDLKQARSGFQPGSTITFRVTNHFSSSKTYHYATTISPTLGNPQPGQSGDLTVLPNTSADVNLTPTATGKLRITLGGNLTLSTTLLNPAAK